MNHSDCVDFLRWAMPRLELDWSGFRRCHRQVCKRLSKRIADLDLTDFSAYRSYILDHDTEWEVVDGCCRVTVSRFYRDRQVFERLAAEVLPLQAGAGVFSATE